MCQLQSRTMTVVLMFCVAVSGDDKLEHSRYTPDWNSLDSRPLPRWYDEAKVGIFMHFGPYAVPGFGGEWFWNHWANNNTAEVQFMKDNYPPKFTYQDFGPQLMMEFFNASWISDIVAASGARYLVFTSKHHDGFTNWPSPFTFGWNSVDVGPKRNILQELKTAFKDRHPDIHFGLYYSLFEWFNPIFLQDQVNNFTTRNYVLNKMLPEMHELVEKFSPDVLWSDGDWTADPEYFGSKEFLAWLYNDSPSRDTVVVNDRWGIGTREKHGDFYSGPDRWTPGHLVEHKFENAMTVDRNSWGYRRNIKLDEILTPEELIRQIATTISCHGNILINIGPTKDGTIIPIFEERLRQIGGWLKVNGEAIYATQPWIKQKDSLSVDPETWYTASKNHHQLIIYAIVLGWPSHGIVKIGDVTANSTTEIQLIGYPKLLSYKQTTSSLLVYLPPMNMFTSICGYFCQWGYVLKIVDSNHILD